MDTQEVEEQMKVLRAVKYMITAGLVGLAGDAQESGTQGSSRVRVRVFVLGVGRRSGGVHVVEPIHAD